MDDITVDIGNAYELTFLHHFKRNLERLPNDVYPIIDRALKQLQKDPFAKNNNATRMKNVAKTFRMRIGIHVRMLYRVLTNNKRVEILSIGQREDIYEGKPNSGRALTQKETQALLDEIRGKQEQQRIDDSAPVEIPIEIEELDWITRDELYLLDIPQTEWPAILEAKSIDRLQESNISPVTKTRVEDYWTNPSSTQIEKLYTLSPEQGVAAIAEQPLSYFLVALDPEQKKALKRIKNDGPYLVKGSAGTGKSLVGLYHIRDLILSREAESLFDTEPVKYGVITYTNVLVETGRSILRNICSASNSVELISTTLDKIVYKLVSLSLGKTPCALDNNGIVNWLAKDVVSNMDEKTQDIVGRLGLHFVSDEIEQVIFGNAVRTEDEYLKVGRQGRKRGLRENERKGIWAVFLNFTKICERKSVQTFAQWRVIALDYIETHPEYPRFSVLFVDEAQDLSRVARKLCLELVNDPRHLLMAADTGQSIYTVPPSWKQTDERFDFRRRRPVLLERSYRSTCQIGAAIAPLRLDPGDEDDACNNASPVFSGPAPRWIDAPNESHVEIISKEIAGLKQRDSDLNLGQVAVIVRDAGHAKSVVRYLQNQEIAAVHVDQKTPLDINDNKVHVLTAHSSKGLGFPIVFVPFVSHKFYPFQYLLERVKDADQKAQLMENEQRLLYVALSRASFRLYMLVDSNDPSSFVENLQKDENWNS